MIAENSLGWSPAGRSAPAVGHHVKALAKDQTNKHGYTYAVASQHSPETLTVWHNGKLIFTTWRTPVFRPRRLGPYRSGVHPVPEPDHEGTNPDGSKYATRSTGWPTSTAARRCTTSRGTATARSRASLRRVAVPPAKSIWPYHHYGTLVTVIRGLAGFTRRPPWLSTGRAPRSSAGSCHPAPRD